MAENELLDYDSGEERDTPLLYLAAGSGVDAKATKALGGHINCRSTREIMDPRAAFSGLAPELIRRMDLCGIHGASLTQQKIIPAINSGLSLCAVSGGGMGKTTSICIGALHHVMTRAMLGPWSPAQHGRYPRYFRDCVLVTMLCLHRYRAVQQRPQAELPVELLWIIFNYAARLSGLPRQMVPAEGYPHVVIMASDTVYLSTYASSRELKRLSPGIACASVGQTSSGELFDREIDQSNHYGKPPPPTTLPLAAADRKWVQTFLSERDPHIVVGTPAVVARLAISGVLRLDCVRLIIMEAMSADAIAPGGSERARIDELLGRMDRTTLQTVITMTQENRVNVARLKALGLDELIAPPD